MTLATELERLQQLAEEVARLLPKTHYWQVIVTRRGYGGHECEYRTEEGVKAAALPADVAGLVEDWWDAAIGVAPLGSRSGDARWKAAESLRQAGGTVTALSRQLAEREAEIARYRSLVIQYRDDLRHPPASDSKERRLEAINLALGGVT